MSICNRYSQSSVPRAVKAKRETQPTPGKPWLVLSARSSGVGNGSVRAGPMSDDPENRSESGSEEGEHRHRQLANGIKNQRITKAQDRILKRMPFAPPPPPPY